MATPKELALRALARTTECLRESFAAFPKRRWRESPRGQASSLVEVLEHLYRCEYWWRGNLGLERGETHWPALPTLPKCRSVAQAVRHFDEARDGMLTLLAGKPDEFFENPVPTCRYGGLLTGAELCLYLGEHDFYHAGQIRMLEMAFAKDNGGRR